MPIAKIAIAFYNLENLFDTTNDPNILDDDFTPNGDLKWNDSRYAKKLKKLSEVISQLGQEDTHHMPSLVGVAEVENKKVLQDLVNQSALKEGDYDFVHYNSPDERGIDTALLYRKADFEVISAKNITLLVDNAPGIRDFTRDILYVNGKLKNVEVHILVNHWPSRHDTGAATEYKRIIAAKKNREIIDKIRQNDPNSRIIIMGDFNDDPNSEAVKNHLVKNDLYNPMVFLLTRYEGSLNHHFKWHLFDQIILSNSWMKTHDNALEYEKSDIFNKHFLTEYEGKFKGNPFRTYAGENYLGGFSDHFPVYTIFKCEN
ncbi:MAG: endonuclease [Leeuwenhoekiella sp.]